MPDKTTNGRAEAGFVPLLLPFGLDALMELNRPALAAMAQVNGKVYESLATMNQNWAAFLNRRLKEELDVAGQLAACKSVPEVYRFWTDYLQTAVSDYRAELEQMSRLGKSLADGTIEAMHTRANDRAHEQRPPH